MSFRKTITNVCLFSFLFSNFRHGTELEKYFQRYLYPSLAIFGILGNMLNLTVLLNRRMRSRFFFIMSLLKLLSYGFKKI